MKKFLSLLVIAIIIYSSGCKTPFIQTSFCTSLNGYIPLLNPSIYDPLTRTLKVSWFSVSCANQYQLEWTFAGSDDSSTLNPSWTPDFRFNSTRVVTSVTHYSIPIIYEEGTLIFRLRCVKLKDSSGQALFSSWSRIFVPGQNAGLTNLYLLSRFQVSNALAHEGNKLNWQYSTKYFDEGGRNDDIQYLDGTLRQRQLVTYSNSDTLAVATNTVYDYNGRAAIKTLPAPVIYADSLRPGNQYARHIGFFPKQVLVSKDTIYTYRQFDVDQFAVKSDSCAPAILKPRPLSTESGASRYYSSDNQDKAGFQGFVPDAGGFPYTQTQWTDDNTNRVIRQSAPGQRHFIGSNHELSFRYADVAQDEIDMLFGNDAGDERYYKKTIKTDPNGQMSVEYAMTDGKVVATALAGPLPNNLDSIGSQVVPINVDIVGTEQTAASDGLSKFSSKTFDLSINTSCAFGYRLLPRNFEKILCTNQQVCLDCRYKVQLLLKDQNGNVVHQVDTAIGTLQQNCTAGNGSTYRTLFTKILCKGNYTVSRTLVIDTSGFDGYFRSYLKKADSCGDSTVIFPIPEQISSTCSLTCADCNALPDSLKAGLKEYCDFICNKGPSPCDQAKAMMLINLSPGGQYAQYDKVLGNVDASKYPLSIYYNGKWRALLASSAPADLSPYLITNDLNGMVNNWKPAWAEYFLPLHPEYCYYRFCKANDKAYVQSKQFNDDMLAIENGKKAVASVYIDPLNNDPSLNTFGIATGVKSRLNNFRNGKNIKEFIYSGFANCKSVPPYNNNFAKTPDTIANNMQWQMFRAMYMSVKNQVIDSLREVYVKDSCGGFCNKCIGDSLNYYTTCNPPNCNIPVDSTCNALRNKFRIFPSTFSYQEQLPFRLTGVDSLDLEIIQNYSAKQLSKTCRCGKHDQIEGLFRYVINKGHLTGSVLIPDTLCSVGIAYETIPGYKGDVRWVGTVQAGGSLDVTLYDTLRKRRCEMNFITTDSLIPWQKIVLMSCLRPNRIPGQFNSGPNIFLVDLYDSTYKKYTAEAKISCIDTGVCKPPKTCNPVCDENGLEQIFNCGFANGNSTSINLKDSLIRKWLECIYKTKITGGQIIWKAVRRGDQYIVTLTVNAITGNKKIKLIDSCQYIFDFGKNINYAGGKMEVISIEPDRTNTKDTCRIYGIKMILKVQFENLPPTYITVYGRPTGNCFPIAECCEPEPPKKCPNEFSNILSPSSNINTDTIIARLGVADTIWTKKFALNNSGYYYFSFYARTIGVRGTPPSAINSTILLQQFELRIDDSVYTSSLQVQNAGSFLYFVKGRIPFRFKRSHRLQLELKAGNATISQFRVRAYDFSLVGENCDDCCYPVFPPFGTPDPAECDSTKKIVDGYNGQIIRSQYLAELRAKLKGEFIQHCISNIDSFGLKYADALYHFTLYYYDQGNNLVTTIPPKGVHLLPTDSLQKVKLHRQNPAAPVIYPAHTFRSEYQYSSLNQVTQVTTPDAGTARNWFDAVGRLSISQQARQAPSGRYNYMLYDRLSRIVQSGEFVKQAADIPLLVRDSLLLSNTLRTSDRYEVNTTYYDQPFVDSITGPGSIFRGNNKFFGDTLNYLRHRVAATTFVDTIPAGSGLASMNYQHAIHYWYDMHGFIRMLVHEIPALKSFGQNLKRGAYDYELLSGLVKKVRYQQGESDQFFTRYEFDADTRLVAVYTSLNDSVWERDARYYYNKHFMLARMEIGPDGVQGLDYAYTIQGLPKSTNSFTLREEIDPGSDGDSTGARRLSAIDMFGYEIGYFKNDYQPINSLSLAPAIHTSIYDSLRINDGLYNGNIRYVVKSLRAPAIADQIQASIYTYDQINRLTSSAVNPITINPGYVPSAINSPDYATKLKYDANGNILSMLRNGTAAAGQRAMDALTFNYNPLNNQLQFIGDTVNSNNYTNDIDASQPGNYKYDASGNLTKDVAENIDSVLWNSRGKIVKVIMGGASSFDYTYNSLGNRFSASSNGKTTYYITDAHGNVLATYVKDTSGLRCKELTIYGSKRLGIFDKASNGNISGFIRGNKQYELNDHLGNVLLTISDKKVPHDPDGNGVPNYFTAEIVTASDYYPFGMQMPLRTISDTAYRYGFNGKEKDNDVKGKGNQLDFGARIYDPRAGRFLSVDPRFKDYPGQSSYVYSSNNPVLYIDAEGEGPKLPSSYKTTFTLMSNHPIEFLALVASNNTSPKEFVKWAKEDPWETPFAYQRQKGAFGEAEVYKRLMTDWDIDRYPVPVTSFGMYYKGLQVDIQSNIFLHREGAITVRNYSFEGNENELAEVGHVGWLKGNFEVKAVSPKNRVATNFEYFMEGLMQTRLRTDKKDNAIGVFVTDKEAWQKVAADPVYGPELKKLYDRMIRKGGYLRLEENLHKETVKRVFKAKYDVLAAEKKK